MPCSCPSVEAVVQCRVRTCRCFVWISGEAVKDIRSCHSSSASKMTNGIHSVLLHASQIIWIVFVICCLQHWETPPTALSFVILSRNSPHSSILKRDSSFWGVRCEQFLCLRCRDWRRLMPFCFVLVLISLWWTFRRALLTLRSSFLLNHKQRVTVWWYTVRARERSSLAHVLIASLFWFSSKKTFSSVCINFNSVTRQPVTVWDQKSTP